MDLIKKNMASLIFALVAVAAVVLLFWPINGYYADLNGKVGSRSAAYSALNGLNSKTRPLPQVEITPGPDVKQLDKFQFPTQNVIDAGKGMIEKLTKQREAVWDAAMKMNQHELLVPNSLPKGGVADLVNFSGKYKSVMDMSIEGRKNNPLLQTMHAGFLVTKDEVAARRAEIEKEIDAKTIYTGNVALNEAQINQEKKERLPYVGDKMRQDRAEQCQVYVDQTALDPYKELVQGNNTTPDPNAVFLAQMGFWVHEDVARSIAAANEGAKNVMESPIKHLFKIQLNDIFKFTGARLPAQPNDPALAIKPVFDRTPTGRVVNGLYDVVRFTITINVDAEQVPQVLQALSRDKFMTVLWVKRMDVQDAALWKTYGYFYGDKPIVQLELFCEDIFLRAWSYQYMPPDVIAGLGAEALTLPAAPAK